MKEWWLELSIRERLLLSIGGSIGLVLLGYFLLWTPLSTYVNDLHTSIVEQQSLLTWMQNAIKELQQLQAQSPQTQPVTTGAILSIVEESIKKNNLDENAPQITQSDQDKVTIKFTEVPFDNLISWLTDLWKQYQISIEQLNVIPAKITGVVAAEIVLTKNR